MKIIIMLSLAISLFLFSCTKPDNKPLEQEKSQSIETSEQSQSQALITFYEIGSVTCIPCKEMKKVMKAVEENFGNQVDVVFIDINEESERAAKFDFRLIPTQVFHDNSGKEIHRHEGFYSEEDISKFLQSKGLKNNKLGK